MILAVHKFKVSEGFDINSPKTDTHCQDLAWGTPSNDVFVGGCDNITMYSRENKNCESEGQPLLYYLSGGQDAPAI